MACKLRNNFLHLVLKVMADFRDHPGHFFIEELTDNSVAYCESPKDVTVSSTVL